VESAFPPELNIEHIKQANAMLTTVERALSGHPHLSGQFSKSRFFAHTNVSLPGLGGQLVAMLCLSLFVILPVLKGLGHAIVGNLALIKWS